MHIYCHVKSEKKEKIVAPLLLSCPPILIITLSLPPSPSAQKIVLANLKPTYTLTDKGKLPYSLKLVKFLPDIDRHKISLESEKFNLLELHSS